MILRAIYSHILMLSRAIYNHILMILFRVIYSHILMILRAIYNHISNEYYLTVTGGGRTQHSLGICGAELRTVAI